MREGEREALIRFLGWVAGIMDGGRGSGSIGRTKSGKGVPDGHSSNSWTA